MIGMPTLFQQFLAFVGRAPISASQTQIFDTPDRTSEDCISNGRLSTSDAEDSSAFCINPGDIQRETSYPTASGGLGDVYKCIRNCGASLDESNPHDSQI